MVSKRISLYLNSNQTWSLGSCPLQDELDKEQIASKGKWALKGLFTLSLKNALIRHIEKWLLLSTVLQKAFDSFAQGKGYITPEMVGTILRVMGQAFNDQTLRDLIADVDEDG